MQTWQLQTAKARLSEVVRLATSEGPQTIAVRGENVVVVLSQKTYEDFCNKQIPFLDFMAASPLKGVNLDLTRDKSPGRDVDL